MHVEADQLHRLARLLEPTLLRRSRPHMDQALVLAQSITLTRPDSPHFSFSLVSQVALPSLPRFSFAPGRGLLSRTLGQFSVL